MHRSDLSLARNTSSLDARGGASNLLVNGSGVKAGDIVLIIAEPPGLDHYDSNLAAFLAEETRLLGATAIVLEAPVGAGPEDLPDEVFDAIGRAQHTIFLSRVGDQLRFTPLPGDGVKTMVHALDLEAFGSPFGHLPYGFLEAIHDLVVARLARGGTIRLSCPRGTNLVGELSADAQLVKDADFQHFTLKTFPVMITPTIPAASLSGTLAPTLALTSTAVHDYEDSVLPLPGAVSWKVKDGRITEVAGDDRLAGQVRAHLERVAKVANGDPWRLNSFHTGINPTAYFERPALSDLERWTAVAFGSPRYTHFHMCGHAPGEVSAKIFDPTITLNGEALWRDGWFAFLDFSEARKLAADYGVSPALLKTRQPIGL